MVLSQMSLADIRIYIGISFIPYSLRTKRLYKLVVWRVLVCSEAVSYHLLDKSFFHFLLIVHVDLWFYVHREESISYAHCCLHFACRWNSSSLGSVAKFVCLQISYRVMWTLPQVEQVVQCTGRG